MSGNPKQATAGGSQNVRFQIQTTTYQSPQQRTDGFQVSAQPGAYVQQQPNQGANQGPGLRGIAPPGQPNQSSTPPNTDLKVQALNQQSSMNHMFVQNQVRSTQAYNPYNPRSATGPTSQPRMPNQHNRPQQPQVYPTQQYVPLPQMAFITATNAAPMYINQRPQSFVQPTFSVYPGQPLPFPYATHTPSQNQSLQSYYYANQIRSTGPPPQAASAPPNPTQPTIPSMPIAPMAHQPYQKKQNKRRPMAIAIIDPNTGEDRLNEVYEDNSHPPSGESSARQTPQPAPHNPNKEVQAAFAKQVAQAISKDEIHICELEPHDAPGNTIEQPVYSPPTPAVQNTNKDMDHLVQSSVLKAQAKEFVSSTTTAKETPIVSANCDAVEVTLPNKLQKDRESPAKGRKREQTVREYNKDSLKESTVKDSSEKQQNLIVKEEVKENENVSGSTNFSVVPTTKDSVPPQPQHIREDKRNPKKDIKIESKVPSVETSESVTTDVSPVTTSIQHIPNAQENIAKSKQNVSQKIVVQKQPVPQTNQKATPAAVVPVPQPAKGNNKSHKKSEINLKGANKEGTDMDVFNDNTTSEDNLNANLTTTVSSSNDVFNSNSISMVNNKNQELTVIDTSKKNDDNDVATTIKVESKPIQKTRIDITDIVKDRPKPIKPFTAPIEAQDETDRAPLSNEKLVQAKNEANIKVNTVNDSNISDVKNDMGLPYGKDQWSPSNQDGKKIYERDFLLALRNIPASKKRPDNLPDIVIVDDRPRYGDGRGSVGGRTDFTPPFANYGGKSSSQRGVPPKRNSQTGKLGGGGGGGKGSKAPMKISLSVREDVKLHEVENAWRPARLNRGTNSTDEDKKTEELYRKVRGVLNKLTPQKFTTLVQQVRELEIDTVARLQGVIDLVFEKAVDEPNFSVAYALMCKELAMMQVPSGNCADGKKEYVNFRKLIVTRCQAEFEKQSKDESNRNMKLKEIEELATDPEKKKELLFELDEQDRKLRMKSVGNIRFIGELFKKDMLTVNIMMRCLTQLLGNKDAESLECLCKLLTTVGKEVESKVDLTGIFDSMKAIVEKKPCVVSSRVRFMLLDVIELKNCKWIPRRQDLNPKTIDQIQKEAESEHMNIQALNSVPITPRKDERGISNNQNSDRKRKNVVEDGGWVTSGRSNRGQPFTVQSDKLKNKLPLADAPLGSQKMFGNWIKGSNIKNQPSSLPSSNMYSALENIDSEKRSIGSSRPSSKDPYSSKGPSMERTYKQSYDGRGSRSDSQHRSYDNSVSTTSQPPSIPCGATISVGQTSAAVIAAASEPIQQQTVSIPELTEEQLERRVKNCLDEYLNDSCSVDEYEQDISSFVPTSYLPRLVSDSYQNVLERSKSARRKTGSLFAKLIKIGKLSLDDYCIGLEEILSQAEDLTIDIPMIWDYLTEIIVDLIVEEALPLRRLHEVCKVLITQNLVDKLISRLFKLAMMEKGPKFLESIWKASGLHLTDFMSSTEASTFVVANKLEFLCGGDYPVGQFESTWDQIHEKMTEFLKSKTQVDDITKWITVNVGQRVKEEKFIRVLATAIFEDSISRNKLDKEKLASHYTLLHKFVDNDAKYELQCLFALQALINKMEHPQGLLLSICDKLYEDSTFAQESFITWEGSADPAEQEGKGVALKQLTSFFTQLKENEEEDYDGSSSSEEA